MFSFVLHFDMFRQSSFGKPVNDKNIKLGNTAKRKLNKHKEQRRRLGSWLTGTGTSPWKSDSKVESPKSNISVFTVVLLESCCRTTEERKEVARQLEKWREEKKRKEEQEEEQRVAKEIQRRKLEEVLFFSLCKCLSSGTTVQVFILFPKWSKWKKRWRLNGFMFLLSPCSVSINI